MAKIYFIFSLLLVSVILVAGCKGSSTPVEETEQQIIPAEKVEEQTLVTKSLYEIFPKSTIPSGWEIFRGASSHTSNAEGFEIGRGFGVNRHENHESELPSGSILITTYGVTVNLDKFDSAENAEKNYLKFGQNPHEETSGILNAKCSRRGVGTASEFSKSIQIVCVKRNILFSVISTSPVGEGDILDAHNIAKDDTMEIAKIVSANIDSDTTDVGDDNWYHPNDKCEEGFHIMERPAQEDSECISNEALTKNEACSKHSECDDITCENCRRISCSNPTEGVKGNFCIECTWDLDCNSGSKCLEYQCV